MVRGTGLRDRGQGRCWLRPEGREAQTPPQTLGVPRSPSAKALASSGANLLAREQTGAGKVRDPNSLQEIGDAARWGGLRKTGGKQLSKNNKLPDPTQFTPIVLSTVWACSLHCGCSQHVGTKGLTLGAVTCSQAGLQLQSAAAPGSEARGGCGFGALLRVHWGSHRETPELCSLRS